ncbi:MAG: D-serine deaminase-like pyridoxal phosphate-dependent protein [Kiritimatiellia bacterium]|jgi:D-serine deaminase-like pyridoxal phosphate-dependent protein
MSDLHSAIIDEPLPAALLDMDALDHNLDVLLSALHPDRTLRIASKSIRCVHVLRYIIDRAGQRVRGLMTMSPRESLFLYQQGLDDQLVAYPVARPADAAPMIELARSGATTWAMIDCAHHVNLLETLAAAAGVQLDVCLDLDMAWRPAANIYVGARRSPIRTPQQAVELASHVRNSPHLSLTALMGYEAQIASLPDRTRGSAVMDNIKRRIKAPSIRDVRRRRSEVRNALEQAGHSLMVVNGGGTGSVQTTSHDPSVTEVTAGSGFFCPHLFDGFDGLDLRPAAFFALPVSRRQDGQHAACHGGGYPASGASGTDRWPLVHDPAHLRTTSMEGWGEVQTPFRDAAGEALQVGGSIIARHAKAGELCEHFAELLLIRRGIIVDRVPTYRGMGQAF